MKNFETVDDVLDFAIASEVRAYKFYESLAEKMDRPAMKQAFLEFAEEEHKHERMLLRVKEGHRLDTAAKKVTDLKIGDYLVDAETSPNMTYQEALILAIKRETAAMNLYTDLAASTDDNQLQMLFGSLAEEEAKHKLRFETEYDDNVFKEN